jgi:hypothetical protein
MTRSSMRWSQHLVSVVGEFELTTLYEVLSPGGGLDLKTRRQRPKITCLWSGERLIWLVPLYGHDPLFLQVDSLSFHLVQIFPVRSVLFRSWMTTVQALCAAKSYSLFIRLLSGI